MDLDLAGLGIHSEAENPRLLVFRSLINWVFLVRESCGLESSVVGLYLGSKFQPKRVANHFSGFYLIIGCLFFSNLL